MEFTEEELKVIKISVWCYMMDRVVVQTNWIMILFKMYMTKLRRGDLWKNMKLE
jgi:hypothetical protein